MPNTKAQTTNKQPSEGLFAGYLRRLMFMKNPSAQPSEGCFKINLSFCGRSMTIFSQNFSVLTSLSWVNRLLTEGSYIFLTF